MRKEVKFLPKANTLRVLVKIYEYGFAEGALVDEVACDRSLSARLPVGRFPMLGATQPDKVRGAHNLDDGLLGRALPESRDISRVPPLGRHN